MSPRSLRKVRRLTTEDLGLTAPGHAATASPTPGTWVAPLPDDDPLLLLAEDLLRDYGGILFTGPPGTSKSHYAVLLAETLAGSPDRVVLLQFHPSYQYEDFIEGYVPDGVAMALKPRHFANLCYEAGKPENAGKRYVLVIDELSRSDPGRVFGEALTYIERSKRGIEFSLPSGRLLSVPPNIEILATMNPLDRGVDEVDAALNRRFAKIAMDPSEDFLNGFLIDAGMTDLLRERVLAFFRKVNRTARSAANPHAALGHTYFRGIRDLPGLVRLWDHQLRFHFDQAYRLDAAGFDAVRADWNAVVAPLPEEAETDSGEDDAE